MGDRGDASPGAELMSWSSFWVGVLCAYAVPWIAVILVVGVSCALRDWIQARRRRARVRRGIHEWAQRTFGDATALTRPGATIADVAEALAAHQAHQDAAAVEDLLRSLPRGA